ncbi:siderophore-interacting protein [Nakamurella silvestris]|nr:siderophore-interacting protein [Nakamurella silvestris]
MTSAAPSSTRTEQSAAPFGIFQVRVRRIEALGENFRRFTFEGPDLATFADNGRDQRIKLIFPLPRVGLDPMPTGTDWYQQWRELPADLRNPLRTYTVRNVRNESSEIDVDIAVHGRVGVASAWAVDAAVGDELKIFGPDNRFTGVHGGVDFLPPSGTGGFLLAGDETALPAIASILERLPADSTGEALIEVAADSDRAAVGSCPPGVRLQVLSRDGGPSGSVLVPAVREAAARLLPTVSGAAVEVEDVDIETGLLWEVPADESGGALARQTALYAWLAGEAGVIKTLRRHLVSELGMDRRSVAFMGYWRTGRAENNS